MINYTEKGIGLHEVIRAAGHVLKQVNGAWVSSNDAAVQAIIDAYIEADAAAAVGDDIDAYARTLRARILKDVDPSEMAAWATKYAEAKALQASGKPSDAPNLVAEAAFRGITLTVLATKVIQKFNQTANREARIAGLAGKYKDIVANLGSFDAINAYDWKTPMAGA
jgi:hypothetical protein